MAESEKVGVVVGASMGIGRALALMLAEWGYDVVCAARSEDKLQQVAQAVRERGRRALVTPTDVTDVRQVQNLVDTTLREWGRIDTLMYCSGGPLAGVRFEAPSSNDGFFELMGQYTVGKIGDEDWDAIFAINFLGGKRCIEAVLPHMRERDSGRVVVVTSKAGRMQEMIVPGMVPYAVSKAAMSRYVEALAFELMAEGSEVKISAFSPGMIAVSLHENLPEEERQHYGKPEDVERVFRKVLEEGESGEIYEADGLKTWAQEFKEK